MKLLIAMVEEMRIQIRFREPRIYELISQLACNSAFSQLDFLGEIAQKLENGQDFHKLWGESVNEMCLDKEDCAIITALGNGLGTSDSNGQNALLELTKTQLLLRLDNAVEAYSQKGKMYRSLGVLCGAGLGIMVM